MILIKRSWGARQRRRRPPRTVSALLASGVMVIALVAALGGPAAAADSSGSSADSSDPQACSPDTTVTTDKGKVCGITKDGVTHYLSIPFAAPPISKLRWKPPQPHKSWEGVLKSIGAAPHCWASGNSYGYQPAPNVPNSEDCLNLEVRVPANTEPTEPGASLPVMVEFHGGGFVHEYRTDGADHLLKKTHTIYVYVNYRQGILGFLAAKALGPHSGDYGLMDQYAGLQWVHDNIAKFGGDPDNVTIFGESAGGASECYAMTSPDAKGLFQKAIAVSPFWNYNKTIVWPRADCKSKIPTEKQAQKAGAQFAKKVGCGDASDVAACLRKIPPDKLVKAASQDEPSGSPLKPAGGTIAPIVNGTTIPMSPAKALATGQVNDATLIFDEGIDEFNGGSLDNTSGRPAIVAETPAQYRKLLGEQFSPDQVKAIEHKYPLSNYPDPSSYIAYRNAMADAFAVCPTLTESKFVAKHVKQLYVAINANRDYPPDVDAPTGAYHSATNYLAHADPSTLSPNQLALQTQILNERRAMTHTGTPNAKGAPHWPLFSKGSDQPVMLLLPAGDSMVVPASLLARQHHCEFWSQIVPQYVGNRPWYTHTKEE